MTTKPPAAKEETLTAEQVRNWRLALVSVLGAYALMMPVEQIQALRDKVQEWANEEAETKNGKRNQKDTTSPESGSQA